MFQFLEKIETKETRKAICKQMPAPVIDPNTRFEFEELPIMPMPAPAALPELPPQPPNQTNVAHPTPILGRLPTFLGYESTMDDEDYSRYLSWFMTSFSNHVEEFPKLKNHFLRSHAGGGTPDNPYAVDWGNMRLNDFRAIRTQGIAFFNNRTDQEKAKLEQVIKRVACFAIYHKDQAPDHYLMPDQVFKSYVETVWTWNDWIMSLTEE